MSKNASGRKARYGAPMVRATITIPVHILEFLRESGNGNVSDGVRATASKVMNGQQVEDQQDASSAAGAALEDNP